MSAQLWDAPGEHRVKNKIRYRPYNRHVRETYVLTENRCIVLCSRLYSKKINHAHEIIILVCIFIARQEPQWNRTSSNTARKPTCLSLWSNGMVLSNLLTRCLSPINDISQKTLSFSRMHRSNIHAGTSKNKKQEGSSVVSSLSQVGTSLPNDHVFGCKRRTDSGGFTCFSRQEGAGNTEKKCNINIDINQS